MAAGKWIGAALGWVLSGGSILGALAGLCIGSLISDSVTFSGSSSQDGDNRTNGNSANGNFQNQYAYEENRNSFFFSLLVLSSYIIKADGKVMHSEMEFVRAFLNQNFGPQSVQQGEEILLKLFETQKQQGPSQFKETIRKSCVEISLHMEEGQRLQLLSYLVMIAQADGSVSTAEVAALKEVAVALLLKETDVDELLNFSQQSSQPRASQAETLENAYKLLSIPPTASDSEVKAAYRKMALKYHPDRVAALGEDVRKAAEEKFQKINAAKEIIFKARGL